MTVSYGPTAATGTDFGYNFDTVVNTNDMGQGSLRQFIVNANALSGEASLAQAGSYTNAVDLAAGTTATGAAGVGLPAGFESSIFMIPAGRLTDGVADRADRADRGSGRRSDGHAATHAPGAAEPGARELCVVAGPDPCAPQRGDLR